MEGGRIYICPSQQDPQASHVSLPPLLADIMHQFVMTATHDYPILRSNSFLWWRRAAASDACDRSVNIQSLSTLC